MCMICVDFQQRRMTLREARRALVELRESLGEHEHEVEEKLRLTILDADGRWLAELPEPRVDA